LGAARAAPETTPAAQPEESAAGVVFNSCRPDVELGTVAREESTVHKSIHVLIPSLAAALLLAACGSSSKTTTTSAPAAAATTPATTAALVKTASIPSLGATVLVNNQGMTLYHLSGEQSGKFICNSSACLSVWHPLTVTAGGSPTGAASLSTVKRSDGTVQVTYKGAPLYTFAQDTKEGEAKGQGLKDVGTWSVVTMTAAPASAPATTAPSTTTTSEGSSSKYGY
jgi:predicted lipoprotein with Yx(FWY)xxD motif